MTTSRQRINEAAISNRWLVSAFSSYTRYSGNGCSITVYWDGNERVDKAYFHDAIGGDTDRVTGGLPAIIALLKMFGR